MTDKIEVTGWDNELFNRLFCAHPPTPDEAVEIIARHRIQSTAALQAECDASREALGEAANAANDMILALNDTVRPITPEIYNSAGKRIEEAVARIDALLEKKL